MHKNVARAIIAATMGLALVGMPAIALAEETSAPTVAQTEPAEGSELVGEGEDERVAIEEDATAQGDGDSIVDADGGVLQAESETELPVLSGTAHVQSIGWKSASSSDMGILIGTTGLSKRVEAFTLKLSRGSIMYKVHGQGYGWTGWSANGAQVGTTGQSKRVEAVRIRLSDDLVSEGYSVQYRAHCQSYGWSSWTADGEVAGTTGFSKRLEAIEVRIVRATDPLPTGGEYTWRDSGIVASAHVQKVGWKNDISGYSVVLGSTGRGLRLEALKLDRSKGIDLSGGIRYRAHVQKEGWQAWVKDGAVAGSMGKGRRIEAVSIELYGQLAQEYDVWYRAHVQRGGWLDWAKNGQDAGSIGLSMRVEAIEVRLLKKSEAAPGRTDYPMVNKVSGSYALDVELRRIVRDVTGTGPEALKKAYDYVTAFEFAHYAPTPSASDDAEVWSKEYALQLINNNNGNCYRYSALFSWIARALGYDSIPVIGRIQSKINVYSVHCWSEVELDGVVYMCDPDLQRFLTEKDFYMQTYEDAPAYFYDATGWPMTSYGRA